MKKRRIKIYFTLLGMLSMLTIFLFPKQQQNNNLMMENIEALASSEIGADKDCTASGSFCITIGGDFILGISYK